MEAEGLTNAFNAVTMDPPNFDPIMNMAIHRSGNESGYPLDERSLKEFLDGYNVDRRGKKTAKDVQRYSNAVFEVYNQLFELRDIADNLKTADEHKSGLVMTRITELLADLNKIVARGKIPPHRNAEYCQLNTAIIVALTETGLKGPLRNAELWNLIKGASVLHIEAKKASIQKAEGVEESRERYYAHVVPAQDLPKVIPESTKYPIESLYLVQDIIEQFKNVHKNIVTNKENEKKAYDKTHLKLTKAIDDLEKLYAPLESYYVI